MSKTKPIIPEPQSIPSVFHISVTAKSLYLGIQYGTLLVKPFHLHFQLLPKYDIICLTNLPYSLHTHYHCLNNENSYVICTNI